MQPRNARRLRRSGARAVTAIDGYCRPVGSPVLAAKPLPSHWAQPCGLGQATADARQAAARAWASKPLAARRDAQAVRALAVVSSGANAPVFSGAAAGLVKIGTSPTENIDPRQKARDAIDREMLALEADAVVIDPSTTRLYKMGRSVRFAAKLHAESTDHPSAMFTLTNRPGEVPDAKDVSRFIDNLKMWVLRKFNYRHLRYVWVAELQAGRAGKGDAGAVHYHVAVWLPAELRRKARLLEAKGLKASGALPKPDKKGWWKKGSTERDWVRKSVRSYLSKYLSKGIEGGSFPKGLRIHGAGGFHLQQRLQRTHNGFPAWLRKETTPEQRWHRISGGWESRESGERCASPYECILQGAVVKLVKRTLENHERLNALFRARVDLYVASCGGAQCA